METPRHPQPSTAGPIGVRSHVSAVSQPGLSRSPEVRNRFAGSAGYSTLPFVVERGVVRQRFKIWHYYNQPVEIQRIALLRLDMQGVRHDDGKHANIALLSQTEIPVGESIDVDLSFDTQRYSDALALVYKFEGTSADGKPAMGEVPVMKPPPKPTRENSTPVRDPAVAAKIKKALRILGRDTVSQEDIWQLEREGKLQQ